MKNSKNLKTQLEKNLLDLEYNRRTQLLNAVVIFGTVGVITLLGSFIWYPERLQAGAIVSLALMLVAIEWYKRIEAELNQISERVRKLAEQS